MDLITAVSVLVAQAQETNNSLVNIMNQCFQVQNLANQENSVPAVNPQIKAIIASIDANMSAFGSQTVLLQGAIDEVARIVNE